MSKVYQCDMCGKQIKYRLLVCRGIEFFGSFDICKASYDLCEDCWKNLRSYIEKYKNGEQK